MWSNLTVFLVGLLFSVLTGNAEIHFKKGSPHVILANKGLLMGKAEFSRDGRPYHSFVGIPYATVPERFAEGKPLEEPTWEGVMRAIKPGMACPQSKGPLIDKESVVGEDCLNLNVYIPMKDPMGEAKKYPVMVWVHGGGFRRGESHVYGAKYFMDEDVILVTFNYRLGVFGFLSTEDEVVPGNNGMKDCVLALQWVQKNIGRFGGDPGKVTIFGESAGGAAVHHLLLSPTTKGLFHRAISQSGTALHEWSYRTNARELAVGLTTHMKCPTVAENPLEISSQEILNCLREAPLDDLILAQSSFKASWPFNLADFFHGPSKEPKLSRSASSTLTPFLTESTHEAMRDRTRSLRRVPWMVGINEDEGAPMYAGIIVKHEKLLQDMNTNWHEIAPSAFMYSSMATKEDQEIVGDKIKEFYFGSKPITVESRHNISNIYTDVLMGYGVYKAALETATRGKRNPVYLYQYTYPKGVPLICGMFQCEETEMKKVGHGDELSMLFDMNKIMAPGLSGLLPQKGSPQENFSKNLVKLWTSFAIHGEPKQTWGNSPQREWKPISKEEVNGEAPLMWYRIDENPGQVENPYKERHVFTDALYKEYFVKNIAPSSKKSDRTEL